MVTRSRVALATCAEVPEGDEDAPPLIEALAARGVEAVPAIWDDQNVDWAAFDVVVVRSTWDYPDRRADFLAWAESLPHVRNSADVLRWNTDKRYLDSIPSTISTDFLEPGARFVASDAPFVVKPSVGAGSIEAARYDAGDERADEHVRRLHAAGKTVMVQPYLEAVDREGETALLYLGGEFSHAVRKAALLPRSGEIGEGLYLEERITATQPSPDQLELAERALDAAPFDRGELLYARVDLLPGPVVLEVELTEPSMFLVYGDGSAERFADAITAAASAGESARRTGRLRASRGGTRAGRGRPRLDARLGRQARAAGDRLCSEVDGALDRPGDVCGAPGFCVVEPDEASARSPDGTDRACDPLCRRPVEDDKPMRGEESLDRGVAGSHSSRVTRARTIRSDAAGVAEGKLEGAVGLERHRDVVSLTDVELRQPVVDQRHQPSLNGQVPGTGPRRVRCLKGDRPGRPARSRS